MQSVFILLLLATTSITLVKSVRIQVTSPRSIYAANGNEASSKRRIGVVAAVLPGSPLVTGTISQGLSNAVSIYSNIIFLRIALTWFPQLPRQFPILRPIFTVTDPYLKIFRSQIPPIGGFDISAIPAIFCLEILSNTAIAIGAEIPSELKKQLEKVKNRSEKERNAVIAAFKTSRTAGTK